MLIRASQTGIDFMDENSHEFDEGYGPISGLQQYESALGETITSAALAQNDTTLVLEFRTFSLQVHNYNPDSGCDTTRYITLDGEDISYYVGAIFFGLQIKPAGRTSVPRGEYGGYEETEFLDVHTSKGVFTVACHNDHNGYYGGFNLHVYRENKKLPLEQLMQHTKEH